MGCGARCCVTGIFLQVSVQRSFYSGNQDLTGLLGVGVTEVMRIKDSAIIVTGVSLVRAGLCQSSAQHIRCMAKCSKQPRGLGAVITPFQPPGNRLREGK